MRARLHRRVVLRFAALIVVWFEAFLDARRHWLDRNQYRWHFRVAYFGLNVVLVGAMVLLYALIFFSGIDGVRYTYVALAGVSIAAPAAHCALYVTLSLQFAPFPLRGGDDESRAHRSRVVVAWACGRALWGFTVVTACAQVGTAAALRRTRSSAASRWPRCFCLARCAPSRSRSTRGSSARRRRGSAGGVRGSLFKKFYLLLGAYPATPLERRRGPLGGIVGCEHRADLAVVERVDEKHLE